MQLYDRALGYFEEVFAAKPDSANPTMLRNMLAAYRKLERTEEALDFGQRAIAAHGDDAQLLSAYADVLNQAGRRAEAVAMLDRVVQIDPQYAVGARRAIWLLEADDLSGARAALEGAIQRNEMDDQTVDNVAKQILLRGYTSKSQARQFQAAIPYFEMAKEYARTPLTRAMASFFHGHAVYSMADELAKPQTKASAERTLPMFRQVMRLMNEAEAYTDQASGRQSIMARTTEHINIAELLITLGG
jgi:tetratricopeptide (TPR) repeat protein